MYGEVPWESTSCYGQGRERNQYNIRGENMAIRPEADRAHFLRYNNEREVASKLDEAFDVTFGSTLGELSFWFAAPKRNVRERFGFNKEVLVIYSPHTRTDARIFNAIHEVMAKEEFRYRLEVGLAILVHNGDDEETRRLLQSQAEWVIIPFKESELKDLCGSLFVRARIADVLGSIDLFGMTSPITTDRYFFGRNELVQQLLVRTIRQGENSGLFGLRKTGKTSVLYALERRIQAHSQTWEGGRILVQLFDCSNPGIHSCRWWQLLEEIIIRLQHALDVERASSSDIGAYKFKMAEAPRQFTNQVKLFLTKRGVSRIILLFDEIEYITPGIEGILARHWDQDFVPFWQTIRATHQEANGRLTFVIAGVNPRCLTEARFNEQPNPLFQIQPYYLEPFTVDSVREMVRTIGRWAGLKPKEDVYPYLKERYGGHPFLIRIACSEVWKHKNKKNPEHLELVTVHDFEKLAPQIQERLAQPIKDILLSLVWWYPEEYELLQILVEGDETFVKEYLEAEQKSLLQLARYGLFREGTHELAISDLKEFLKQYGETYKKEVSPFTRGDMPPELLPEIPDLQTLSQLFAKRCEVELKLRSIIYLYLGMAHGWNERGMVNAIIKGLRRAPSRRGPDPKELFVGRPIKDVLHELYTLELKFIILENWDLFKPVFEHKARFEMNMDTINKARRVDAHTKPVSGSEVEEFMNSYTWLFSKLKKIPEEYIGKL
ncbi:MAG: ATP-binding protein [Thermoplasmata archaeon]|nr:MAG: ATP-binding protein [Thermoplasmata archaeon]